MKPQPPTTTHRRDIIQRHARLTPTGRPILCHPGQCEINNPSRRKENEGTDHKIIYNTYTQAAACARELERIGARPMHPYECRRSKTGHHHLATDRPGETPSCPPADN